MLPFSDTSCARRRHHHLSLRAALADDRGVCPVARRAACCITTSRRRPISHRSIQLCSAWRRWRAQSFRVVRRRVDPRLACRSSIAPNSKRWICTDRRPAAVGRPRTNHEASKPSGAREGADVQQRDQLLFVGRIAPNKKIEDHLKLAERYKRYIDEYIVSSRSVGYDAVPAYYSSYSRDDGAVPPAGRSPFHLHRAGAR